MYKTCKYLISVGRTAGLQEKIDTFYAFDRLTKEEYEELCRLLTEANGSK